MSKAKSTRDGSPVKAGPKKVYGPIIKNAQGVVVSGQRKVKILKTAEFSMPSKIRPQAYPPRGKLLDDRLNQVSKLQREAGVTTDPFMFARMRAHVRAGIEDFRQPL